MLLWCSDSFAQLQLPSLKQSISYLAREGIRLAWYPPAGRPRLLFFLWFFIIHHIINYSFPLKFTPYSCILLQSSQCAFRCKFTFLIRVTIFTVLKSCGSLSFTAWQNYLECLPGLRASCSEGSAPRWLKAHPALRVLLLPQRGIFNFLTLIPYLFSFSPDFNVLTENQSWVSFSIFTHLRQP